MARLVTSGFESNSATAGVEECLVAVVGAVSISSTLARSGTYSLHLSGMTSGVRARVSYEYATGTGNGPYFFRAYVNFVTFPTAENNFFSWGTVATGGGAGITVSSSGQLQLYAAGAAPVGSASSALNLNQWYRIEVWMDRTPASGSRVLKAAIDGVEFASSSTLATLTQGDYFVIGGNLSVETQTQGEWYFDDIAVNDNTGSFQTSYPGAGNIISQHPNGAGDSTAWTPKSGTNWSQVDEVTPDGATSYVTDGVLNDSDFYTVGASGIPTGSTITLVNVAVYFANDTADATTAFKVQIKKTTGGTVSQSSAITPNATAYKAQTAAGTVPQFFPLKLYQDPDSTNWTQTTVDSSQIGVQSTLIGVNKNRVSTLWTVVEYIPSTNTARLKSLLGVGL